MAANRDPTPESADRTLSRVGETSLRMMAGAVSPACQRQIRQLVLDSPAEYPWAAVVEAVLAEPVDPSELVHRGLVAQRNWVLRSAVAEPRAAPRRRAGRAGWKALLAMILVRGSFYGFFAAAFVFALVVLKHKWPEADVYRILDWLREVLPGLFGPR